MSKILKANTILNIMPRFIGKFRGKNKYTWEGEGIKYPGFTFYPRTPDFKDPPCEPSKLFRVQRIKALKGRPYWEEKIMQELGLVGKKSEVSIVKNLPENNSRLWRVKHLIKITPITFPNGAPNDVAGTFLKENGELTVMKKVDNESRLLATEKFENDHKKMNGDTLRRDLRKKWLSGW